MFDFINKRFKLNGWVLYYGYAYYSRLSSVILPMFCVTGIEMNASKRSPIQRAIYGCCLFPFFKTPQSVQLVSSDEQYFQNTIFYVRTRLLYCMRVHNAVFLIIVFLFRFLTFVFFNFVFFIIIFILCFFCRWFNEC